MPDFSISPTLFPVNDDNKPLPLLVAEKWDFPLAYAEQDGEFWYAVQDWIMGVASATSNNASRIWTDMQRRKMFTIRKVQKFRYKATDGKTYKRDYTDENGLLVIIDRLRVINWRKQLRHIRNFLASNYPSLTHLAVTMAESSSFELNETALQNYLVEIIKNMNIYDHVQTQKKLSSYRTIDIVASSLIDDQDILIECKLDLTGSDLYRAIGQVLVYAKEYEAETGVCPIPVIATVASEENENARKTCQLMGIELWELSILSENEFALSINGVDQITGKPLLQA